MQGCTTAKMLDLEGRSGSSGCRVAKATLGRRYRLALVVAVLITIPSPACGQSKVSGEYEVKAAFLFHFAQFVEWPSEAFQNPASPFIYCTIGEDPFRGELDRACEARTSARERLRCGISSKRKRCTAARFCSSV